MNWDHHEKGIFYKMAYAKGNFNIEKDLYIYPLTLLSTISWDQLEVLFKNCHCKN